MQSEFRSSLALAEIQSGEPLESHLPTWPTCKDKRRPPNAKLPSAKKSQPASQPSNGYFKSPMTVTSGTGNSDTSEQISPFIILGFSPTSPLKGVRLCPAACKTAPTPVIHGVIWALLLTPVKSLYFSVMYRVPKVLTPQSSNNNNNNTSHPSSLFLSVTSYLFFFLNFFPTCCISEKLVTCGVIRSYNFSHSLVTFECCWILVVLSTRRLH